MKINLLPDDVINKIAAGEVIERPSSVVRELVDNSLDAGATAIDIALEGGGNVSIRVSDNGSGILKGDAITAFTRHATSKIRKAEDLFNIETLGFRGEALSSIAAVSRIKLTTREKSENVGTSVSIEGGVTQEATSVSRDVGTDVLVKALFFNTPARRKFLKSDRTELSRIKDWVVGTSLAHPSVRFTLTSDGKEVLRINPASTFFERAEQIYKGSYVAFERGVGPFGVSGRLAPPSKASSSVNSLTLLVNDRLVLDRVLLRAVKDGFDSTLKEREVPTGVLSIKLPPSQVDINVHPQKSEVRFLNPGAVFAEVRDAVLEAVKRFRTPESGSEAVHHRSAGYPVGGGANFQGLNFQSQPLFYVESDSKREEPFRFSSLKYIGQLFECYLLCEKGGEFVVVDMHAAHERYNFNLIRRTVLSGEVPSQGLLVPKVITFAAEEREALLKETFGLSKFGFELEPFGENEILVRSAPSIIPDGKVEAALRSISSGTFSEAMLGRWQEIVDHIAARMACHGSVRSGEILKREEVYSLFEALDSEEFSAACPHGRPIVVSFGERDIERWFGRDR